MPNNSENSQSEHQVNLVSSDIILQSNGNEDLNKHHSLEKETPHIINVPLILPNTCDEIEDMTAELASSSDGHEFLAKLVAIDSQGIFVPVLYNQ